MLRWVAKSVSSRLSEPQLLGVYDDLVEYLPLRRRTQFLRAWVLNHLVRGRLARDKASPNMLNVSPTYRCNLNCRGCYASAYDRSAEMTYRQFDGLVREARAVGVNFIGLLGGEPLLRKDLFPLLRRHADIAFRISTNGTLVDDDVVRFLKSSGNTVLFFSLEGLQSDTDSWRAPGVYRQIREAMDWLRSERVLFGFSAVVHAENRDVVLSDEFFSEMHQAGARIGLFFPYGPVGGRQLFDLVLSDSQAADCYARVQALKGRYPMALGFEDEPTCTAGRTLHITPDGNAEPCNGVQFHTVNVFDSGLRAALEDRFYREVADCAAQGHRCVGIHHPEQLLQIVKKSEARESNRRALARLCRYIEAREPATEEALS